MGCIRLDILDEQYYKPTTLGVASEFTSESEYLAAENVGAAAEIIFSAKSFSLVRFFLLSKRNEQREIVAEQIYTGHGLQVRASGDSIAVERPIYNLNQRGN
ncbi:MAG: hypothetical protein FWG79_00670 [Bacteroidales bacterium]|nr:hypothetical protein [Bacteroidales bacterium]